MPGWTDVQNETLAEEFAVEAARTLRAAVAGTSVLAGFGVPLAAVTFDPAGIDEGALFTIAAQLRDQLGLEDA